MCSPNSQPSFVLSSVPLLSHPSTAPPLPHHCPSTAPTHRSSLDAIEASSDGFSDDDDDGDGAFEGKRQHSRRSRRRLNSDGDDDGGDTDDEGMIRGGSSCGVGLDVNKEVVNLYDIWI